MKKSIYLFIYLFIFITASARAQIEVSAPDTSADQGSELVISITVSDLTGLDVTSCQIDLKYDSTVVKPTEVSLKNSISELWISDSWEYLDYNLNDYGSLHIAAWGPEPLIGSGVLLNISFDIIGLPFDSTELIFELCEFNDGTISTQLNNGKLKVNSNKINVIVTTNVLDSSRVLVDDTLRNVPYETQWIKGSTHTIETLSPQDMGNGVQYLFNYWSDEGTQKHTVHSRVDTFFTAYFSSQYYLTLISDYGTAQGEAWYDSGEVAFFSIEEQIIEGENTRHNFVSWIGNGENSYSGIGLKNSVIMTNPITEQANWSNEYYLQVNSLYGSPFGQGWYFEGDTAYFGVVSITISTPLEKYYFNSWTGQGTGSYSGINQKDSVVVNNPIIESANWDEEYYVEIKSNPAGLIDISGSDWYSSGDQFFTITAFDTIVKDTSFYFFKEWLVNGKTVPGNPITVNVDSPLVIIANYRYQVDVTVTTSVASGTKVIVDELEYEAPYAAEWMSDETHTISVEVYQQGETGVRYVFDSWNDSGEQTHVVISNKDTIFTANLRTQYYLEVTSKPEELITIPGSGWYNADQDSILLNAPQIYNFEDYVYRFKFWKIDGYEIRDNPIFLMMDSSKVAEANYKKAYFISGFIAEDSSALTDVQLVLSGAEDDTVYSNREGYYEFKLLFEGGYKISPSKPGYKFIPESRDYELLKENLTEQNFVSTDSLIGVNINADEKIPEQYILNQNYPNPFNSETIIQFSLPQKSTITLTVYNLLGKSVKSFFLKNRNQGCHSVQWNGKDNFGNQLPSGIYFYKLMANDEIISKKMIILE